MNREFDQCANDAGDGPCSWVNGVLNASNASYYENDGVPQRLYLYDVPSGSHTLEISYQTTKSQGGVTYHAYDYLVGYNYSETYLQQNQTNGGLCKDISGCSTWPANTFPIPVDPNIAANNPGVIQPSNQVFTILNGTISNIEYVGPDYPLTGDTHRTIRVTFSTVGDCGDACSLVLGWAGHVAAQNDWGIGKGAMGISGAPYHIDLGDFDGGPLGSEDNQLNSNSLQPGATLVVTKDSRPDSPQDFSFNLSGKNQNRNFALDDPATDDNDGISNTARFLALEPGEFVVSEQNIPAGWALTGISCLSADANSTYSVSGTAATVELAAMDMMTCTFVNEQPGVIIIEKQTAPDGAAQSFEFDPSWSANNFSLSDGQTKNSGPLAAGTYNVSETLPIGWEQTSATCSDGSPVTAIVLAAGETVTCAFVNTLTLQPIQPGIEITKTANPTQVTAPGGDVTFTVRVDNVGEGSLTLNSLVDDMYGFVAPNPSGTIKSTTCAVPQTIAVGGQYQCTFVAAVTGAAGATHKNTVIASATAENNEAVSDDDDATVNIVADVLNLNLTSLCTTDPTVRAWRVTNPNTFAVQYSVELTTPTAANPQTAAPGTSLFYTSAIAGPNTTKIVWNDENGVVQQVTKASGNVMCAEITIVKSADPSDNTSFSFDAPDSMTDFSLAVPSSPSATKGVTANAQTTYAFKEINIPSGWMLADIACTGDANTNTTVNVAGATANVVIDANTITGSTPLFPMEKVTCTFTNVKPGRIIIAKQTSPAEDTTEFEFDPSWSVTNFKLSNGQSNDSGALRPATYSVSELALNGWTQTGATCSDGSPVTAIVLSAGEQVTCTFVNTKDVVPGTPSISLSKTPSPSIVPAPGANIDFTVVINNIGDGSVTIESLQDDKYGDIADNANPELVSTTCVVPKIIAHDASYSCVFRAFVGGPAGSTHVNIVTADGIGINQIEVTSSDDASVAITGAQTNTCLADTGKLYTTSILGMGMGNPTTAKSSVKLSVPNSADVVSLYGQYVGKDTVAYNGYARFTGSNRITFNDQTMEGPASRENAEFWFGQQLVPANLPWWKVTVIKGMGKPFQPRAFLLYPAYRQTAEYWDYFDVLEDSSKNFVYWEWMPSQTYEIPLGEPLTEERQITVQVAVVDNDVDARAFTLKIEAGGQVYSTSPATPNRGDLLNIITATLDAPAGTDKVTITLTSPQNTGDSVAMVGVTANYLCEAVAP